MALRFWKKKNESDKMKPAENISEKANEIKNKDLINKYIKLVLLLSIKDIRNSSKTEEEIKKLEEEIKSKEEEGTEAGVPG